MKEVSELLKPSVKVIPNIKNDLYSVCDQGYVVNNKTGRILKPYINTTENKKGYVYVRLQNGPKAVSIHVGILVGRAFVPNPDNKPCINHDDGNKLNNHYTNLKWVTHKENNQHAMDYGLAKSGLQHYNSKFSMEDIIEIRELSAKNMKRFEIARIYNVSETAIDNLITGRTYRNLPSYEFSLLRPRFKVTASYPFSPYKIGDIITTGENSQLYRMFNQFPNVFSPLPWYAERDQKDLPEYVTMKRVKGVFKVKKYTVGKYWYVRLFNYPASVPVKAVLPSTQSEYETYINSKQ